MTKAQLAQAIAAQTFLKKDEADTVIDTFMRIVKDAVAKGDNIELRGFGVFQCVQVKERKGRHILANQEITIPAHNTPKFKPSKEFIEKVKDANQ